MIRTLCLRLFVGIAALIGMVVAAGAQTTPRELADLLRMDEVIAVMRDEGLAFGDELGRDTLGGLGGAFWTTEVSRIYDPDKMTRALQIALANSMTDQQRAQAAAFFDTDLGQRILSLETSARAAMANEDVEEIARATYDSLKGTADTRLRAVSRFVSVNDLLERNVAGALNANYQFLIGMVDGGASDMTQDQIVVDVWAQEDETRADTENWLYGFLLMAYRPLSDTELQVYIDYSETPSGQALNTALFQGFGTGYRTISYDLGRLVARASAASDL